MASSRTSRPTPAAPDEGLGASSRRLLVFEDPPLDGPTNMARDEFLMLGTEFSPAALRLYAWAPPTLSLGCFQRFTALGSLPPAFQGLPVVRRLTGGGAILHDCEVTYCLVADADFPAAAGPPAQLYALVHRVWQRVLADRGGPACEIAPDSYPLPTPRTGPFFCFEKPGRTDLLLGGAKVLGSAQRRLPTRVMQHGSLILTRREPRQPGGDLAAPPAARVSLWCAEFGRRLAEALGLAPAAASWRPEHLAEIERLRPRFAGRDWTQRM